MAFLDAHGGYHVEERQEHLAALRGVTTPEHIRSSAIAMLYRGNKYNVFMRSRTYHVLMDSLKV